MITSKFGETLPSFKYARVTNINRKYIGVPRKIPSSKPTLDKTEYHEILFKTEDERYNHDYELMVLKQIQK